MEEAPVVGVATEAGEQRSEPMVGGNLEGWRATAGRVKELRDSLGLTQTEFARRLGVSQACTCEWERGNYAVSRPVLLAICHVFRARLEWLLDGEGEMMEPRLPAVTWSGSPLGADGAGAVISLPGLNAGSGVWAWTYRGPDGFGRVADGDILVLCPPPVPQEVAPDTFLICRDPYERICLCSAGRRDGKLFLLPAGEREPVVAASGQLTLVGKVMQVVKVADLCIDTDSAPRRAEGTFRGNGRAGIPPCPSTAPAVHGCCA